MCACHILVHDGLSTGQTDWGVHVTGQCRVNKCHLGKSSLEFLGHIAWENGNQPNQEQLQVIDNNPAPKISKQVQKFFGLVKWLREFIEGFDVVTALRTELLSPQCRCVWGEKEEHVNNCFRASPTLARYNASRQLYMQTDASQQELGVILYKCGEDNTIQLIHFASDTLGVAKRKYDENEHVCLAVVWV
ncbi:hypothetical protein PR048_009172, partial [Dryococelus australis]